jgi:hypothetical protein
MEPLLDFKLAEEKSFRGSEKNFFGRAKKKVFVCFKKEYLQVIDISLLSFFLSFFAKISSAYCEQCWHTKDHWLSKNANEKRGPIPLLSSPDPVHFCAKTKVIRQEKYLVFREGMRSTQK